MFTQKLLQLTECALTGEGKYGLHLGSAEQFTASIILCWRPVAIAPDSTPSTGSRAVKLVPLVGKMRSVNIE